MTSVDGMTETNPAPEREATLRELISIHRTKIQSTANQTRGLMQHGDIGSLKTSDSISEAKANIMLAYRHLEDARMRLDNVIQILDGGMVKDRTS